MVYGGSFSQHFLLILLTGKQCPENKLGLFIKGKAVWQTPASYVTNAVMTKAWCGQRERMISCLWQQNSAQRNWILSPIHSWKQSAIDIDPFQSRLQIAWSRSTCNSMRVKIDLSHFNQIHLCAPPPAFSLVHTIIIMKPHREHNRLKTNPAK